MRPHASEVLATLEDCVANLYQGRMRIVERLVIQEWAMVGSLGNDELTGANPRPHRALPRPEALLEPLDMLGGPSRLCL
jgi:hypothetical protein